MDFALSKIENFIDTPDNKSKHYLSLNPTAHIPMIKEGQFTLLGGEHTVILYIVNSRNQIKSSLYPLNFEAKIRSMMGWYNAKLKTPCQQLMRMVCEP